MRKLFSLMSLLLLCIGGAWAQTYTITYGTSTGTFYNGSNNAVIEGWIAKWVSNEEGKPAVTLTASANNINAENGRLAPGKSQACTYSLSVEEGYAITGFSMNCPTFGAQVTITPAGEEAVIAETGTNIVVNSSSTSFVYSGNNSGRIQAGANDQGNFQIYVIKLTPEQFAAQKAIPGWISTIQNSEGLVTDASKYSSNAKSSVEGSYAALLDGEYTSYFHSAYGNEGPDEDHYLQAELAEPVDAFFFYYKKRSGNNNNRPTSITISGSNDGTTFTDVTTISSGLPTSSSVLEYVSNKIELGGSYKYIRFTVTATNTNAKTGNGHVFFTFSEFYLLPSNTHVDAAMDIYKNGKAILDYTTEEIEQINSLDLEIRSAALAPAKALILAQYTIPDGKVGKLGYPTQTGWDTFVAAINAITIEDDFDAKKNEAINALLATSMPTNGVYKIRNASTNHYLFQDEVNPLVTYASTEAIAGNHSLWRITNNGDGTYQILDLYGHQLAKGTQSATWAYVSNGYHDYVTTIERNYSDSNYKVSGENVSFYLAGAHINTAYSSGSKVFVTTWTTGGVGSPANHWYLEPVDVSELTEYTVSITGASEEGITLSDGTKVYNEIATTVYLPTLSIPDIANYEKEVTNVGNSYTVTYTATNYEALINDYLSDGDKYTDIMRAGTLGYPKKTTESYINLYGLLSSFVPGHTFIAEDYSNIKTYYAAYKAETDIVLPAKNTFFRIRSILNDKPYLTTNDATPASVTNENEMNRLRFTDATDATTIFFWDDKNGLVAYSNGVYCNMKFTAKIGDNPLANNIVKSVNGEMGQFSITFNYNNGTNFLYSDGTNNSNADRNTYASKFFNNNSFTIEPVSELKVSLTDLSKWGVEGCYTTLYMPVAVKISEEATAYAVVKNDDGVTLDMVACPDNVVPANTGVILNGNYAQCTATLSTEAGTATSVLTGTTPMIGTVDGCYVLSVVNEKLGFYKFVGTELKGFRAFYVDETADPTRGFVLNTGDLTGINPSLLTGDASQVYDLQGRRVVNAQKGLYIINGKKVVK